ncbi:hypothetical protein DAMA08_031000 [Martiniozyma asiatica (nom. inval.)]|nr:hypothetical protein DAMA08_031000 [Martiniozyma asiatica]
MSSPVLYVPKPSIGATVSGNKPALAQVFINSSALLELIDTIYYDNSADDESNNRVIGTLLGSRSDDGSEVTVKACYTVPLKEENGDLIFQDAYHLATLQLYKKSNPDLLVVGWFSNNKIIDTYTGLVHDIYSKGSNSSVFLTIEHLDSEGKIITPKITTYTTSTIGLPATSNLVQNLGIDKSGSYVFTPIPNKVFATKSELVALKFISAATDSENNTLEITGNDQFSQLQATIQKTTNMIKIIQEYVSRVKSGEIKGDESIALQLISQLKFNVTQSEIEKIKANYEERKNEAEVVEYLASCLKQQLDLSSKLTNFVLPEEAANM